MGQESSPPARGVCAQHLSPGRPGATAPALAHWRSCILLREI